MDLINFKVFGNNSYEEINNFLEYQIEDSLRFFGSTLPPEDLEKLKYFMKIKNAIMKSQYD